MHYYCPTCGWKGIIKNEPSPRKIQELEKRLLVLIKERNYTLTELSHYLRDPGMRLKDWIEKLRGEGKLNVHIEQMRGAPKTIVSSIKNSLK